MSEQIQADNSAVIERLERERDELASQVERLREALNLVVDDLRMRADVDDDGLSVVNISDFVWHKLCDAQQIREGKE